MTEFKMAESTGGTEARISWTDTIAEWEEAGDALRGGAYWYGQLLACSEAVGRSVVVTEDQGLPAILGSGGHRVHLYHFIDCVDEAVDYEHLTGLLPISYGQVHEALSFLRKLMSINPRGLDLDEVEDQEDLEDSELMAALRKGAAQTEGFRVLDDE